MHRLAISGLLVSLVATTAYAQQSISVSSLAVNPGGSINATVNGPVGFQFALIGSNTGSGLAYAGVSLAVGTDVTILTVGAIPGGGSVVVPVTPPFPVRDRYYIQAVVSSDGFASIGPTNGLTLFNNEVAKVFQPLGGGVTAAGVGFALSPGVSVTKTAVGTYRLDFASAFTGVTNQFPMITSFTGGSAPIALTGNNAAYTVTFAADTGFFFTIIPVRR